MWKLIKLVALALVFLYLHFLIKQLDQRGEGSLPVPVAASAGSHRHDVPAGPVSAPAR